MIELKVQGLKEAREFLDGLSPRIQENILRKALRAAAAPIVEGAKSRAMVSAFKTGSLALSLYAAPIQVIDPHTVTIPIEPRGGWFRGRHFYGGYMEWGYTQTGGGKITGGKKARARKRAELKAAGAFREGRFFVTQAFDEHALEASTIFTTEVRRVTEALAAKARRIQGAKAKT